MRKMKDSGVNWIGLISVDWKIDNPKYHFTQRKDRAPQGMVQLTASQKYGVITQSEYVERTGANIVTVQKDFDILKLVCAGDFVIHMRSFQGGLEYSEKTGSISSAYVMLIPHKTIRVPRYYKWFFKSSNYVDALSSTSNLVRDGQAMRWANFIQLPITLPPEEEQNRIADYLDAKCAEIDALTADIQTQIDTLEQYKRSVITEAVTKGLEPDVEMKDSGIAWVGMIPAHWPLHPVYTYFGERKNKNRFGVEDNLLSLSYGRVIRKDINTSDGLLPESFNTYNIVEAGDIIIRPTDLQNDKRSLRTGLVKEHGIITSAYIDLCPIKEVDSRYFHFLLHAYDVMKVFYNMGNGVRQGLNYSEFSRLMVFEPSYDEQVAIADHLDAKCAEIDDTIAQKQEQLSTLEAYKKSLIYEYVTGKKEVSCGE